MPRWIFHAIRMNQRGGNRGDFISTGQDTLRASDGEDE